MRKYKASVSAVTTDQITIQVKKTSWVVVMMIMMMTLNMKMTIYQDTDGGHDYFDTTNWIRIQADIINSHNEHLLLM